MHSFIRHIAMCGMASAVAVAAVPTLPAIAEAQSTGTIHGVVRDQALGPASNVVVRLVDQGLTTRTGSDGAFTFTEVPPGAYVLQVEDERHGQGTERVEVVAGRAAEVTFNLSPIYHLDPFLVTAGPTSLRAGELVQPAQSLSGRDLRDRLLPSLGETLANEPGVSSTYFGPGASRPVIRGLSGDRVRILESGIGSGDASNTSPDHAVSLEPATADRIEVVRGPATLLYGSSAIGGVVNVLTNRIPSERTDRGVTGEVRGVGASAAEERSISTLLDASAGAVAFHVDGSWRKTSDYTIPGFAELLHDEEEEGGEEEVEGTLLNSALENSSWSVGASFLGRRGHIGASVSGYDNLYGVPGGHEEEGEEEEEHAEEGVHVDLQQRRVDLDGVLRFDGGAIETLRLRGGANNYEHSELEGEEVGTRFDNEQWEARLEARHRALGPFTGAVGAQFSTRDFSAIGEEAFTPPNKTDQLGLFALEELTAGPVRFQVGGRFERQTSSETIGGFEESFNSFSVSGGLNWEVSEPASLALNVARSVKLPTAEELFSDGPHLATGSFEIGNRDLKEEVALSADVTVHLDADRFHGEATVFVSDFSDYIFPAFTGNVQDGLQEVVYSQSDARFSGFEARGEVELMQQGGTHLDLELFADYVRATLTDRDEPLPRIPPLRFGGGFRYEGAPWRANVGVRRVAEQDRVAAFEDPTPGYTTVDASVGYRLFHGGLVHELALSGRNLGDTDARNHTSLLKGVAPLPGRDIQLMYRVAF